MQHSEVAKNLTEKAKKLGESLERYETTLAAAPSSHSVLKLWLSYPLTVVKTFLQFFDADWRKRFQWQTYNSKSRIWISSLLSTVSRGFTAKGQTLDTLHNPHF